MTPAGDRKGDPKTAAAWRALANVADPRLDQSVVTLGFINNVTVHGDRVTASVRLPTYWGSAGFAYIIADDMRTALERLEWVARAEVSLLDHFAADEVNRGLREGGDFQALLGTDVAALRETCRRNAYLGRMVVLIEGLRLRRFDEAHILAMRLGNLREMHGDAEILALIARYLDLRAHYGGESGDDDPAFRGVDGEEITVDELPDLLETVRAAQNRPDTGMK